MCYYDFYFYVIICTHVYFSAVCIYLHYYYYFFPRGIMFYSFYMSSFLFLPECAVVIQLILQVEICDYYLCIGIKFVSVNC